jgi:hypothetical protein
VVVALFLRRKDRCIERLERGGCYEREKQRGKGKQEGAADEPKREEKAEEGKEEQVDWRASIQVSEVVSTKEVSCSLVPLKLY